MIPKYSEPERKHGPPLLPYPPGCRRAVFLRREKRFSVLAELDGRKVWAHTNNTGSMLGLLRRGTEILLSPATSPERRTSWTLEASSLVHKGKNAWVGINTQTPNRFLKAAFHQGLLPWAKDYTDLRLEVKDGESRLDGRLSSPDRPPLWVECKNCTLVEDDVAAFPDAVSKRGSKHIGTLLRLIRIGHRAAMLYLVQRPDAKCFAPADYIDPLYAAHFREAINNGMEIHIVEALVREDGIHYSRPVPLSPSFC